MDSRSFTLLEVIAAVAILAVAATGIIQGQSGSVRNVLQSEKLSQAFYLAQQKMTETEIQIQKKGLESFLPEEKGEFELEGLKEFKWVRKIDPVEIGCYWPQAANEESRAQDPRIAGAAQFMENYVRKIVIEVEWMEGRKVRYASLAQLFVNEKDIPTNLLPQ